MPALRSWYCGLARYFPNSSAQLCAESGGSAPVIGFHSVIERPEPVNRVAPPTTTMTKTSAATDQSQSRMPRWPPDAPATTGSADRDRAIVNGEIPRSRAATLHKTARG